MSRLRVHNGRFTDDEGFRILLRGVNLSGSAKLPLRPDGNTALDQQINFSRHRELSFVGRPLILDEADEHLDRLFRWGFNSLRLLVTWEALEHEGPGLYDFDYIDYLDKLVSLATKKGFYVVIDFHQDVWSRFTGGDGAPGWTLEAAGIDPALPGPSDTAILHHRYVSDTKNDYPRMAWTRNHQKYACATMFTLFFGSRVFAPKLCFQGLPLQDFLQDRFCATLAVLAGRLSQYEKVLGFDCFNEPSPGWIGCKDLAKFSGYLFGPSIPTSPFEEMQLSEGRGLTKYKNLSFAYWGLPIGKESLNPKNISIWKDGFSCPWRNEGLWDFDSYGRARLFKPDYFNKIGGKTVNFADDFLAPFLKKVAKSLAKVDSTYLFFFEEEPSKIELTAFLTKSSEKQQKEGKLEQDFTCLDSVYSPHWYEASFLLLRRFVPGFGIDMLKQKPVFGEKAIQKSNRNLLRLFKEQATRLGKSALLLGETGISMELNNGVFYRTGNQKALERAFDRILGALEQEDVSFCLWNYTPDHNKEYGDTWNREDLSIYSKPTNFDSPIFKAQDGARGKRGFSRPYFERLKGCLTFFDYNYREGWLFTEIIPDESTTCGTIADLILPEELLNQAFSVEGNVVLRLKTNEGSCFEVLADKTGPWILRLVFNYADSKKATGDGLNLSRRS